MLKFCKTSLEKAPWNPFDVCYFCKNTKCRIENKDENPKYIGDYYVSMDDKETQNGNN